MKKPSNLKAVQESFGIQAGGFENGAMSFTKQEYLDYTVACMEPSSSDSVLEVAAGTCACGRALAPSVRVVTCLDATPAMLEVGKREARSLNNMIFIKGCAEELPFLDSSFDIVLSRLAFHHFPEVETPFGEMTRVLKPGGKLVLIDMEAAEESLRSTEDRIEKMRDPSHVRNLSQAEAHRLFATHSLTLERCEKTAIPVSLKSWLELTKTPAAVRGDITRRMRAELEEGFKTGFAPYRQGAEIFFRQTWMLLIGRKP